MDNEGARYYAQYSKGKKVAFPLVKNYVTNTWAKFGFEKLMSDDDGVSVWVKLHKVPVVAYSDDGLSLIATQIGKPIMLDAFTSSICVEAWGRIGYARALIEVGADKKLKQEVIIAAPNVDDEGATHTFEKIRVEYDWKPPLYVDCHVFGHTTKQCPKRVLEKPSPIVETDDDGFTRVTNRKSKGNGPVNQKRNFMGLRMPNPKPNLKYEPVKTTNKESKPARKKKSNKEQGNRIKLKNLGEKLNDIFVLITGESSYGHGVEDIFGDTTKATQFTVDTKNKDSDSEVKEVFVEDNPYKSKPKEASTSYDDVSNVYSGIPWMECGYCNKQAERRMLWRDLGVHKHVVCGLPWILMGDFNVALNMEDTYSGSSSMNSAMKLDRIISNEEFIDTFPGAYGLFQPYRISDHSPAVLKIPTLTASKPKPFKFYNFLAFKSNFLEMVNSNWTRHVDGHNMFKVALDSNPADLILREEEGTYVQAFNEAKLDEERFLK
ncbi:trichome birefringence-like protein 3 [Tanacetum coccineum]